MNTGTKINLLLQDIPPGVVLLSSWLCSKGYPYALQQRYRKSGWLTAIGKGAMKRSGDTVTLAGAIFSLQHQTGMMIHIGGRTAMGMQGLAHYIELYAKESLLFAPRGVKLPVWLQNNTWDTKPILINTAVLPPETGLTQFTEVGLEIQISNPIRAIIECLEMVPDRFSMEEAYELMEGLSFLNPAVVQSVLEQCNSVKVTRLFLFLANKAGHNWLEDIRADKLNTGSGKRVISPNGTYIPEYQITVPKSML
jgi:hypothetical protein